MSFVDIMQTYFQGEKLEAFWFILPVGILLVTFGVVALKVERGGYAWGIAIPCFICGLIFMTVGATVGLRTPKQVAQIAKEYEEAPARMIEKELPRMETVNRNFKTMFTAFGISVLIALGLIFIVRTGWARGFGSALVLVARLGFLIDGFASRRALPYTAALKELANRGDAQFHEGSSEFGPTRNSLRTLSTTE